jgi:hypothetical protein
VGDKDIGNPGGPACSEFQGPGDPGHYRARRHPL